jgi:hypothetical protein
MGLCRIGVFGIDSALFPEGSGGYSFFIYLILLFYFYCVGARDFSWERDARRSSFSVIEYWAKHA